MALLIFKPQNLATYLHYGQRDYDALGILNTHFATEAAAQELIDRGDLIHLGEGIDACKSFELEMELPKEECAAIDLNKHDLSEKVERFVFESGEWKHKERTR